MSEQLQRVTSGEIEPKRGFSGWISGRATRLSYWRWIIPLFILIFGLGAAGVDGLGVLLGLPMLLVWIRRLHHLGRTGWWAPVINVAISLAGWIEIGAPTAGGGGGAISMALSLLAFFVLGVLPGQRDDNAFGPPPGRRPAVAESFS